MKLNFKTIKSCIIQIIFTFFIVSALIEGYVAFSLSNPDMSLIPLDILRHIYTRHVRQTIQLMPECGIYDSELTYTLRPGSCIFSGKEFSTNISVNSLGVRDDEESLEKPEIVVLGDSFALGWGVNHEESFAYLLEKESGMKTLNAGISSYGTVREFRLLERIDTLNLKYIILQYCENDFKENKYFFENENNFSALDESKWKKAIRKNDGETSYYFVLYTGRVLILIQSSLRKLIFGAKNKPPETDSELEVKYFLNVLNKSKINLNQVKIIIFEINNHNNNDSIFLDKLRELMNQSVHSGLDSRNIITLDVSRFLTYEMYYTLDTHINPLGHKALANSILHHLQ
jgi:lysophospholipase L1-like esterase